MENAVPVKIEESSQSMELELPEDDHSDSELPSLPRPPSSDEIVVDDVESPSTQQESLSQLTSSVSGDTSSDDGNTASVNDSDGDDAVRADAPQDLAPDDTMDGGNDDDDLRVCYEPC